MLKEIGKKKGGREYSFRKGLDQLRRIDTPIVKDEIMGALGVVSDASWFLRLNGSIEPRVSEAKAIEGVFAKYGITDIWGGDES
jgi:hypothetical protein